MSVLFVLSTTGQEGENWYYDDRYDDDDAAGNEQEQEGKKVERSISSTEDFLGQELAFSTEFCL